MTEMEVVVGGSNHHSEAMANRMHVLVLDDDPAIVRCMGRLLAKTDEVVTASTVGEALGAIALRRPDVILCDLHLADGTGMDFHDAVKALDPLLAARIIFVTGGVSGAEHALQARLDALPNAQLMKPFSGSALRAAIVAWWPPGEEAGSVLVALAAVPQPSPLPEIPPRGSHPA